MSDDKQLPPDIADPSNDPATASTTDPKKTGRRISACLIALVTIPLLIPSIISGALFAFLISFDEVIISWFVSKAQYNTLPVKMYSSIQWETSPVLASISTMLTGLSLLIALLAVMIQKKSNNSEDADRS